MNSKWRILVVGAGILLLPVIAIGAQTLAPPVVASGKIAGPLVGVNNSGTGSGLSVKALALGIDAQSNGQTGVFGRAIGDPGPRSTSSVAGIRGEDDTADMYQSNIGVWGVSTRYGNGVQGDSNHGFGVVGKSNSGTGVYGFSTTGNAVYGEIANVPNANAVAAAFFDDAYSMTGMHTNTGVYSLAGGSAFFGQGGNCDSVKCIATLQLLAARPNVPVISAMDNSGSEVGRLDSSGNLYLRGRLYATVPGQAQPVATIQVVDTARLVNGVAYVAIGPNLQGLAYHVILTPQSDSRGLYVASKKADGFVVRENMGGRSSLAFDYQITAEQKAAPMRAVSLPHPAFVRLRSPGALRGGGST